MGFKFAKLDIPEVVLIEPKVFKDGRGFFFETFKSSEFNNFGMDCNFVQTNHSRSNRGVLRGLHFQKKPKAQAKLIRVVSGEIFDVAVDLRKNSPSYGRWISAILSERNKNILFVPKGFAHGFCVLSDEVDLLYSCSEEYAPETESGIIWNDSDLNIDWPLSDVIVSDKDKQLKPFRELDSGFTYA